MSIPELLLIPATEAICTCQSKSPRFAHAKCRALATRALKAAFAAMPDCPQVIAIVQGALEEPEFQRQDAVSAVRDLSEAMCR